MNKLFRLFIIFYVIGICTLHSDDNLTKFPTEEEMQLFRDRLDDPNDKEAQEAKKAANYYLKIINAAKDAGVKDGHTPTREQELVMMEAVFFEMQEKALTEQKRIAFSKKCFSEANTLKNANECNQKANTMSGFIEKGFTQWHEEKKKTTLENINQFIPCIKNATTVEELSNCHIYK